MLYDGEKWMLWKLTRFLFQLTDKKIGGNVEGGLFVICEQLMRIGLMLIRNDNQKESVKQNWRCTICFWFEKYRWSVKKATRSVICAWRIIVTIKPIMSVGFWRCVIGRKSIQVKFNRSSFWKVLTTATELRVCWRSELRVVFNYFAEMNIIDIAKKDNLRVRVFVNKTFCNNRFTEEFNFY